MTTRKTDKDEAQVDAKAGGTAAGGTAGALIGGAVGGPVGAGIGAVVGAAAGGAAGAAFDYNAAEPDFRRHWESSHHAKTRSWDQAAPAYRFGSDLAGDQHHSGDWSAVEPEARRRWDEHHQGTWDEFKDSIRHAWDRARGRR